MGVCGPPYLRLCRDDAPQREHSLRAVFNGHLYLSRDSTERAKLLRMLCSNFSIDATSVTPTYRYPFNLIFQRANWKNGRGERIRTSDPLLPKQVRYQAALRPDDGLMCR